MFPWLSPVSPANVFYLNSPAGHTSWYVGRMQSHCTRVHIEPSGPKVRWLLPFLVGGQFICSQVWPFNRIMWSIDELFLVFTKDTCAWGTNSPQLSSHSVKYLWHTSVRIVFDVGPSRCSIRCVPSLCLREGEKKDMTERRWRLTWYIRDLIRWRRLWNGWEFHRGLSSKEGREVRQRREKEIKENREQWRSEGPLLFFLD